MPFLRDDQGNVIAHLRMARRPSRICSSCRRRRATLQCDCPMPGKRGKSKTCDAWLCDRCAVSVGPNLDHCPDHQQATLVDPEPPSAA